MKCEKCNEREANFYYSSSYNGKRQERHLCEQCAREEGFGELISPSAMFDGAFGSLFEDFFAPARSFMSLPSFDMFGGFGPIIMAPSLPRLRFMVDPGEKAARGAPMEPAEDKIPDTVDAEACAQREKAALKAQLHDAVIAEDYEKAIVLRDKLREMEK